MADWTDQLSMFHECKGVIRVCPHEAYVLLFMYKQWVAIGM